MEMERERERGRERKGSVLVINKKKKRRKRRPKHPQAMLACLSRGPRKSGSQPNVIKASHSQGKRRHMGELLHCRTLMHIHAHAHAPPKRTSHTYARGHGGGCMCVPRPTPQPRLFPASWPFCLHHWLSLPTLAAVGCRPITLSCCPSFPCVHIHSDTAREEEREEGIATRIHGLGGRLGSVFGVLGRGRGRPRGPNHVWRRVWLLLLCPCERVPRLSLVIREAQEYWSHQEQITKSRLLLQEKMAPCAQLNRAMATLGYLLLLRAHKQSTIVFATSMLSLQSPIATSCTPPKRPLICHQTPIRSPPHKMLTGPPTYIITSPHYNRSMPEEMPQTTKVKHPTPNPLHLALLYSSRLTSVPVADSPANGIVPCAVNIGRSPRLLGGDMGGIPPICVVSACVFATHCSVADACASHPFAEMANVGPVPKLSAV